MSGLRNLIGQTLGGRYRIEEILGKGGMSAVYKAYDPNLRRTVAIKVIHPHLADDPKFITRFREEAAAVAMLRHPNIVQVHDFNQDEDLYYMVQEYIGGETLQDRLRQLNAAGERMPIDDVVRLAIAVCNAAEYAHQRGMIHRDIKPANIMIDLNGQGILMDFGIVKILGAERHTSTGVVVGTALYMSPETIHGQPPDRRSDIYSLGVTLFEMINGRPPYEAESAMAVMMMHISAPVPPLHNLRPDTPAALVAVIEKALAKTSADRYATMAAMAADLKAVVASTQRGAAPIGTFDPSLNAPPASPSPQPSSPGAIHSAETMVEPPAGEPSRNANRNDPDRPRSTPAPAPVAGTLVETRRDAAPASRPQETIPPPARPDSVPVQPAVRLNQISRPTSAPVASPAEASASTSNSPRPISQPASPPPLVPAYPQTASHQTVKILPILIALAVVVLIGVGGLGIFALGSRERLEATPSLAAAIAAATESSGVTATTASTAPPSPTPAAIATPASALPTPAPVVAAAAVTPTFPVGIPFALIDGVSLDNQGRYNVDYHTLEFTEKLEDLHLNFFFNTQNSNQGQIYGGPRPFVKFNTAERPKNALALCVAVANRDNSIRPDSGNCVRLPDVVGISAQADTACLSGPGSEFPTSATLPAGVQALALGISPDESFWKVVHPDNLDADCWLPIDSTQADGDISLLPLAEFNPQATSELFVEITNITVDSENRYAIDYTTRGFSEQLPGTHIHFFYNIFSPEQVGLTGEGNRLMYGGPSPFIGFRSVSRPPEATQICALVANPNHSIIPGSGNCFDLPDT